MDFNFTCNFLTCSVTVPSTEQDMLTLPEHLMSPRVRFLVEVHTVSASVFVSSYSCTSLFSVLCCFCVPVHFVVSMCVISILPCLWIQSFLIIPLPCSFGILLPIREPFSRHTNIYSVIEDTFQMCWGPGWLNELGRWI